MIDGDRKARVHLEKEHFITLNDIDYKLKMLEKQLIKKMM
jgi:hypothetical protein